MQRRKELGDDELFVNSYHSLCCKDVVHTDKLKRAEKQFQDSALGGFMAPPNGDILPQVNYQPQIQIVIVK